jgi:signal transduction histidine kinase
VSARGVASDVRNFLRSVNDAEVPALREHLGRGMVALGVIGLLGGVVNLGVFLVRGREYGAVFWSVVLMFVVQCGLFVWFWARWRRMGETSLWSLSILCVVLGHMMLNAEVGMARVSGVALYGMLPCILGAFLPVSPTRLLGLGVAVAAVSVSGLWCALGLDAVELWSVALGCASAGLMGAVASQMQRKVWLALHQKQGQVNALERLAELGQRTAGVVHALKSPVAAGLNALHWAQGLEAELRSSVGHPLVGRGDLEQISQDLREALGRARGRAEELGALLRHVRAQTAARVGEAQAPRRFLLQACVREAALVMSYQQVEVKVLVVAPEEEVWLWGDAERLKQLLEELIQNATRAMMQSGKGSQVRLGLEVQGEVARLWVEDDGPGVPEGLRGGLFAARGELQRLALAEGEALRAGLGLPICRDIVRGEFQGELRLVEGGQGARFLVELPLREAAPAARGSASAWRPSFAQERP